MTNYLSNLLFGALIFTAPVAAIYLFSVVERRMDAWLDYLSYARLRVECWWENWRER